MQKTILILFLLFMVNPVGAVGFNDSLLGLNLSQHVATTAGINASANTSANTSSDTGTKSAYLTSSDVGSGMVADGINLALTHMGDDITKHYGTTRGAIFHFITWNIKPEQIPILKDFYQKNLKLAFPLAILFILGAVISRSLAIADPVSYTNVFGRKDFAQNDAVGGGLFMLIGLAFGLAFMGLMAALDIINAYLMLTVMDSIAPSIDNGILYLMMALIELLLFVFFIYRQMWIVAGYCFAPLYGLLFASGYLKEFTDSIGDKFLRAMIMQPMAIAATVFFIIVIKAFTSSPEWTAYKSVDPTGGAGMIEASFYVVLFLVLLGVCLWCIFGKMTMVKRLVGFSALKKMAVL
jgi:hypothetical protein